MSEAEADLTIPIAKARAVAPKRRRNLKDNWWRHAVGVIGIVVSLFPLVFVISSAFNRDNTLQGAEVIPVHVTWHNFTDLLSNHVADTSGGYSDAPYVHWVIN